MKQRIIAGEFSKGYDKAKLLEKIPPPSFVVSRTVLCYAPENPEDRWIYFDLPAIYTEDKGYQDILLSIRWPAETFEDGFELTKEGYEHTQRGIANPELDGDTFMEKWKAGEKWVPGASMPTIEEKPRKPLWKHLWH